MNHTEQAAYTLAQYNSRRYFLRKCVGGLGALALGSLLGCEEKVVEKAATTLPDLIPHFAPKAKSVIFLHMAGAPSQLELFDYKPTLQKYDGQACPESLLEGKRFAFLQGVPKMMGPQTKFKQYGRTGTWVSEYLPRFTEVVDDVCFLKAMHTDEFNHAPAQLFMHTGSPRLGRPSMGSWVVYGLGSENENLPGFVVLTSGSNPSAGKSVWGSGFFAISLSGSTMSLAGRSYFASE